MSTDLAIRETGKHPPDSAVVRTQKISRPEKYTIEWSVLNSSDAETADGVVASQASELLKQRAAEQKPFFVAIGFRRPHAPYAAPQKYFDLYPPKSIPPLTKSGWPNIRLIALAMRPSRSLFDAWRDRSNL